MSISFFSSLPLLYALLTFCVVVVVVVVVVRLPFHICSALICSTVTVGTQAAVLAGLDMTMFVEFNPPANSEWVRPDLCISNFVAKNSRLVAHHASLSLTSNLISLDRINSLPFFTSPMK